MHFIYIFLISLANNLDNIGVRIAYSILGIKITHAKNLWISLITFVISSLAAYSGSIINHLLSKQTSSYISALILSVIGLWIMIYPLINKENKRENETNSINGNLLGDILKHPEKADMDCSKDIDFKEATLLGVALSINNIGGGLGAGMIGLNSIYVGLFSAVISFLALWAGNYITDLFSRWNLGNKATILAGLAMILIGIKQMF